MDAAAGADKTPFSFFGLSASSPVAKDLKTDIKLSSPKNLNYLKIKAFVFVINTSFQRRIYNHIGVP